MQLHFYEILLKHSCPDKLVKENVGHENMNYPYPVAYIGNCFTLYYEFLQPLKVNYHLLVNYPQTLKQFPVQAKGFAGSWNFIRIYI